MNKNNLIKIIILIGTTILAFIAVFTALRLYQLRKVAVAPNAPESNPKAAAETTIFISPATQNVSPGGLFTFSVAMNTGANAITGIDVRLNFDPNIVQINSITPGSGVAGLNQTITNIYDNVAGSVSYAIFTLNSSAAVTGSNVEIFKVNARIKPTATTANSSITFANGTTASAYQEGINVITRMTQGNIVVGSGAFCGLSFALATPTPSPTPTRSPSPTPSPTRSPSPIPTRSPSPTPSPTSSPTPLVTGTPSPTPVITAQCVNIKAYSSTWVLLTDSDLTNLKPGNVVNFCVAGSASSGTFDKAQFMINSVLYPETTVNRPNTSDFCQEYQIKTGDINMSVRAKIHHVTLGWVGEPI